MVVIVALTKAMIDPSWTKSDDEYDDDVDLESVSDDAVVSRLSKYLLLWMTDI